MSTEFFEENRIVPSVQDKKGLAEWLVRRGYAEDSAGANRILIYVALAAAILAIIIFSFSARTPSTHPVDRPEPPRGQFGI